MITINDRFKFERQEMCWALHEYKDGKDKDGNPKQTKTTTYHSRLEHICDAIIDRSAGDADTVQGIIDEIGFATEDLKSAIAHH